MDIQGRWPVSLQPFSNEWTSAVMRFVGLLVVLLCITQSETVWADDIEEAMRAQEQVPRVRVRKPTSTEPGRRPPSDVAGPADLTAPEGAYDSKGEAVGQLGIFVLQRGFYFSSDVGLFMSLGGENGYSEVQPYVAIKIGFDVNDTFSLELKLSHAYVSNNPISAHDRTNATVGERASSFGLVGIGGGLVVALRPTARFAIEPNVGGGVTHLYPPLTDPNNPLTTLGSFAPHVMGGVDLKYLTLLTDFSAGLSLAGMYVIGPNIPGVSASFVVRYTF